MTTKSKYESMKREIRLIRNSLKFQAQRLEGLLQEVERISPSDPKPKKAATMDEITQAKVQKLINQ